MYIHERADWTHFRWADSKVSLLIEEIGRKQGLLYGRLSNIGFDNKIKAMAENLTKDVVYSSEIEGIRLNEDEVRSSIARKLGIDNVKFTAPSHYVDSVVAVMLEAVEHYDQKLTEEKLCQWQSAFFPFYIAPSPDRIQEEMRLFLDWFNDDQSRLPSIIRSAIAHFWFVSIHPFEDGNGRLARILSDMLLARGDKNELRFYNISSQINKDKNHYYEILEKMSMGMVI